MSDQPHTPYARGKQRLGVDPIMAQKTGVMRVVKIVVVQETTFGGPRYELQTNQGFKSIHVDPRREPEIYRDMIALVPAISELTWNDKTKTSIVLARFWDVAYCWDSRVMVSGMRGVMVATKITEVAAGPKPDVVTEPDTAKATAIMEAHEAAERERIERENAASRAEFAAIKLEGLDMITDEMINEHELAPDKILFALPNHLAKTFGAASGKHVRQIFGSAFDTWMAAHDNDSRLAWRMTLAYELKNSPVGASTIDENQSSATTTPEAPVTNIVASPASVENLSQPSVVKGDNQNMPESPIVVYPISNGSIVYKGIIFSVTLRLGGTFDMAITLMEQFAAHKELIAPNCLQHQQLVAPAQPAAPSLPMLQPSAPQPPAAQPQVSGEPDGKGRVPGQRGTTNVTGIKKTVNDGKVIYELWSTGQYAVHFMRQDSEHAMIGALVRLDQLKIGTKYPCNWIADWIVSTNRSTAGKQLYFRDVTAIKDEGAALPLAS